MAKNKNTNPAERKLIWEYYEKKTSILQICKTLHFSRGKVRNAIAFYKKHGNWENIPREKPRKTTLNDDRRIAKISKADPFLTSTQIRGQMVADYGVNVSAQTIRRRLNEFGLYGRIAQKKNLSDTNSCDRANDASICELPIKMKKTNKPKDLLDADICEPPIKMKKTNKQTGVLDMSYLQKETDSFQHLELAWAAKLRRMKPTQSKLAERLISEVLFRADLEMLTMDTTVENKTPPASTVSSSCYSQSSTPHENSADRHFRSISQLSTNSHTNTNGVPSTSQDISPPTTSTQTIFPTSLQGPVTYSIKEEEELHDCIGTSEE